MSGNAHNIASLADRLTTLADAYKSDVDSVMEDAKKAEVDPGALRRLVAWQRKDAVKRAEQEAIDHQYRFLAGELDEPATLPAEGELSEAALHYAHKLTVRQVAGVMKVSVGKAQKLKTLAALFSVHGDVNVNTPPHDPDTGELTEAALLGDDAGHRSEPSPPAEQSVNSVPSSGPVEAASVIGEGGQSGTVSRVAMDADGCGTGARQPESAASLAGEAVAPAPIPDWADDPIPDCLRRTPA